jgi:ribosomal protein S18 acetylase RimI-like enzyme
VAQFELKQIYVLSDYYSTGIGRSLHDDAIRTAKDKNADTVWLCVSDINERAKAFYGKLGYESRQAGPIFSVGTEKLTSTIMMLDLS